MKKLFLIPLLILLVAGLVFSGCAAPTPAPAPAPAPAPSPPPAPPPAPAQPEWNLKYHTDVPTETTWYKYGDLAIARSIEEATNGRIKITIYPMESLISAHEMLGGIDSGIVDIGVAMTHSYYGTKPLTEVVTLPFLGIPSASVGCRVLMDLYYKFPALQAEYAGYKVLALANDGMYFVISNKPINSIEDFKGLKIRSVSKPETEAFKRLGATPVMVDFPDFFMALDKGVIDAATGCWPIIDDIRLYDAAKYGYTNMLLWTHPFFLVMSLDLWNSFPPDIQHAIDSVTGHEASQRWGRDAFDIIEETGPPNAMEAGMELLDIPEEEVAKIYEVAGPPVWEAWVTELEAQGLPAREVLNETLRLVEEYK